MKLSFHINIFIIIFSICGFLSPVDTRFQLIHTDKIELVESINADSFKTAETHNYSIPICTKYYTSQPVLFTNKIQIIIKDQFLIYRKIRNNIESTFVISHQTKTLPHYIS